MIVCLNTNTLAVSEYALDAKAVVSHAGKLYLVQEAGLGKLDAARGELPFTAVVETGKISFTNDGKKYFLRFMATLAGDSVTESWVELQLDGQTIEIGPYELPGRSGPASFVRKWRLAGGVKADSLSLRLEGSQGTAWKLQGLAVETELV